MQTLYAKHLKKSYKKRRIIQDVSLTVSPGEIVGLLGPNGAGKTTCFYMIVGLIQPDGGSILLGKEDITHLPIHQRAQHGIGYLPQETSIFRTMTVAQNLLAILEVNPKIAKKERKEECERLLSAFHITHLQDTPAIALSGGERRRVEIARALAAQPQFILLDEPFAGIDPISINDIKAIIKQLSTYGIGVLITDHNVIETLTICQKAYIVHEGQVIAESGRKRGILRRRV
jgi:lipopolysaccharide export system ATP-binding protein